MRTVRHAAAVVLSLAAGVSRAGTLTKLVEYRQGDATLEGSVTYDTAGPARKPGILIFHQWMGPTAYEQKRAEQLAALGYVAFVADVYGKGVRPSNPKEAAAEAGKYRSNRPLFRARGQTALAALRAQPNVLPDKIVAIGYCFGGGAALELGRSGADVLGIVSFHGSLDTPTPEDGKNIRGKVLVLHGADDPNVPRAAVLGLEDELTRAGVDWEVDLYANTVHAFTQPDAGSDKSKGVAYNPEADRRSWQRFQAFLAEVLG
jgi:dienelactone hydrolase